MLLNEQDAPDLLPDYDLTPPSSPRREERAPTSSNDPFLKRPLPRRWSKRSLKVDDSSYPCYYAPATNTHTIIGFCVGFKSSPLAFQEIIGVFNKMGFGVLGLPLPWPGDKRDFMPLYEKIVEAFYCDPVSPLYRHLRPDLPRLAVTHSTGGMILQRHLQDSIKAAHAEQFLKGAINVAPFFDTAYSSVGHHPFLSAFFKAYATLNHSHLLGTAPLDRFYMRWRGITSMFNKDETPTYGQTMILRNHGRDVMASVKKNASSAPHLRQTFILGSRDSCACPETAKDLAKILGIAPVMLDADHNPFSETREGLLEIAKAAFAYGGVDSDDQAALAFPDRARQAAWMRLQASVSASLDVA